MNKFHSTYFAPQLHIKSGVKDISFYEEAFDAVIVRKWLNDDGTIHVAEISINDALFHIHEQSVKKGLPAPETIKATTVTIGLFVTDVDRCIKNAIAAGAVLVSPAQTYDYGYRQGTIKDPFGHIWLIEKKI
jgi:PhnB protein